MKIAALEIDVCHRLNKYILTALILDIDHFKAINDQYGHSVGDEALKHFSDLCQGQLRQSDVLGRTGGEEFAIILPYTDLEKAKEVGSRIKRLVANTPLVSNGNIIPLTVSIGVCTLTEQDHLDSLLEKADKALYQAKNEGRNRVIVYS